MKIAFLNSVKTYFQRESIAHEFSLLSSQIDNLSKQKDISMEQQQYFQRKLQKARNDFNEVFVRNETPLSESRIQNINRTGKDLLNNLQNLKKSYTKTIDQPKEKRKAFFGATITGIYNSLNEFLKPFFATDQSSEEVQKNVQNIRRNYRENIKKSWKGNY